LESKKILSVFTPTYNRAYCLHRVYESLCRQRTNDFIWVVIDDGSTDNTRELIAQWQQEQKINIDYYYKENGGMHTAHNKAYEVITTPFNVCIDSDDMMPDDGVEKIVKQLKDLPAHCCGLIGLDADLNGNIIGTSFPPHLSEVKLNELYLIHKVKGDKKLVLNTDIVKLYPPYPTFPNERFVPLDYLYLLLDQDYSLKVVNEIFCLVEYQTDGSTLNIFKQYRNHPNGFAFSRVSRINYGITFKERFKNAIHLVSSAIFAKDIQWLFKSDKTVLVIFATPFGILLNLYVRWKTRK
jgi:glycosyltransferase involved in cell wall biosynthesis